MTARKAYVRAAGGWLAVSALVGFCFADAPLASRQTGGAAAELRVTEAGRAKESLRLAAVALPPGQALPPSAAGPRP